MRMAINHAIGAATMRDPSPTRLQPSTAPLACLASVVVLVLAFSACSSGSPSAGTGTTVTISGLAFAVAEITVPVGDVTFVNHDGVEHLLAEGENGTEVASPRIQKVAIAGNAQGVITFSAAGDYHVTCLIHHTMNMVIHVQ